MRTAAFAALFLPSLLAGAAHSAELPEMDQQAVVIEPARFDWSGAYVGAQIGYGHADIGIDITIIGTLTFDWTMDGLIGGGHAGYNLQDGNFVFGVEADYNRSKDVAGQTAMGFGTYAEASVEWLASVRGRLGYAFDNLLVFATAGRAWGGVTQNHYTVPPSPVLYKAKGRFETGGLVVGGGAEYAFAENWTARLGYLYYDLETEEDLALTSNNAVAGAPDRDVRITDFHTVQWGISYKF